MAKERDWALLAAIGALLLALLLCIGLLASNTYSGDSYSKELEVAKQDYQRQLSAIDRKYESKVNNLQEQLSALQFISNKRNDLLDDDVKRNKRDIDDLRERMKPRTR